jgi:thioredoxin 1
LNGCDIQGKKSIHQIDIKSVKQKIGKEAMVLEIGSSSCATCIKMKKLIEKMKAKESTLPIYIVDVYDDMSIFSFFNLKMIPTQIVLNKEGKELYRSMGERTEAEFLEFVSHAQGKK